MSDSDRPTAVDRPHANAIADTEPVAGDGRASLGSFPGRYEPTDELGRGGMGRVVEARDRILGRSVALKEALATDVEALRRFARETRITARLEHPSIVPVYDAGVSPEGSPYYVMRKVTGRPLDQLVAAAKRLDERLALIPHVVAACQAVAHAHERGIIHRDLKPSNILAGARGETIVIDWGLAKALDEHDSIREVPPTAGDSLRTRAGVVFGTPGFMAPEQLESADVDERADVYALGATLFYVLAQKPPHEGRTADEVDEAARRRPPPPIASVVPGVPRELATIVDTALAYSLDMRYRNAGALAEELTRFTTGQLVASHVYSRREKLARFVRRNRALVITVGAALVVLGIGAWIAVGRVLAARDEALAQARAAELARAREAERASDLVISQARLLLATNPTAAVAMVRPLATSSRWREVRAIAAGARAAGVPWRLPGPDKITAVELSPAGTHAVVCSADGAVRVYDLAARTHTVIATLEPARLQATFADDQTVVVWAGRAFTVIDLARGTPTQIARPDGIRAARGSTGFVYFLDDKHRPWRLAAATGDITAIPIDARVAHLAPSPDGKRVAFAGEHLWLIESRRPDLVEKIHDGKKFDIAWAADGESFAVLGTQEAYRVTVHPEIEIVTIGSTNQAIALARGHVYSTGLSGMLVGERAQGAADLAASFAGLHLARGDHVVGATRDGMRVFDGEHGHDIVLPGSPLAILRASPRSPYVIAVAGGALLLWNIDHLVPRRVAVPSYVQFLAIGDDLVWTITNGGEGGRAIDLRTGATRTVGKLPPLHYVANASGSKIVARPIASKQTFVFDRDGNSQPLPVETTTAAVLDDRRAVLATADHGIAIYDFATRAVTPLATLGGPIERVMTREGDPRWIVAVLRDGTVWRHDTTTQQVSTTQIAPRHDVYAPAMLTTAATRGGDVFVGVGAVLRRWSATGELTDHVALPRSILRIDLIDDTRAVIVADDRTAYLADLRERERFQRLPELGHTFSFVAGSPLIVTDDRTGGVTVIDLDANAAWKIARAAPQGSTPALAGDGNTVILRDSALDATAIAFWDLALPTTPEATAAWIDGLTNATFDPRTGMLGWLP